jgi:hypothetical protein
VVLSSRRTTERLSHSHTLLCNACPLLPKDAFVQVAALGDGKWRVAHAAKSVLIWRYVCCMLCVCTGLFALDCASTFQILQSSVSEQFKGNTCRPNSGLCKVATVCVSVLFASPLSLILEPESRLQPPCAVSCVLMSTFALFTQVSTHITLSKPHIEPIF